MRVFLPEYTTSPMPWVIKKLEAQLPSIFICNCYNNDGLPFKEEAKKTELPHLFEHILLEVLAIMESDSGNFKRVFRGTTTWNWYEEPPGTFHIRVNVGRTESLKLLRAMQHARNIFENVLSA